MQADLLFFVLSGENYKLKCGGTKGIGVEVMETLWFWVLISSANTHEKGTISWYIRPYGNLDKYKGNQIKFRSKSCFTGT